MKLTGRAEKGTAVSIDKTELNALTVRKMRIYFLCQIALSFFSWKERIWWTTGFFFETKLLTHLRIWNEMRLELENSFLFVFFELLISVRNDYCSASWSNYFLEFSTDMQPMTLGSVYNKGDDALKDDKIREKQYGTRKEYFTLPAALRPALLHPHSPEVSALTLAL